MEYKTYYSIVECFFVQKILLYKSMQFDVKAKPPSNKTVLYRELL